ncbi:MAG: response regulator [Deltaproteobacteria bacterium]|nr:response regulator [Deltaproteobacteria bacterium]
MGPLLIVEDEVATRDALAEVAGKEGREIVTASDGQDALECSGHELVSALHRYESVRSRGPRHARRGPAAPARCTIWRTANKQRLRDVTLRLAATAPYHRTPGFTATMLRQSFEKLGFSAAGRR